MTNHILYKYLLIQRVLLTFIILKRLEELLSRANVNRNTINYTYDVLGRLLKKTYPDSTTENFTYDSKGNILTATNQNISYAFTYDASGKPLSVTDSYGKVIKYEYDVSGNRLTNLNTTLAGVAAGFSLRYDSMGRRTSLTYPNGVTTNYSYDTAGNLTNLLTQYSELQSQGKKKPPNLVPAGFKQGLKLHTLDSFTYTHDNVGNRLSKTEIDKKYDYSYDTIYRLLQSLPTKLQGKDKEQENKAEIFTYDPVGNRLTGPKEKLNYNYNAGSQLSELTKIPLIPLKKGGQGVVGGEGVVEDEQEKKIDFTYDNNGNLIKKVEFDDDGNIKKTTLYSYDYENRLIKVEIQKKDKVKIVTFTYDPFGRRLSKAVHREEIEDDNDNGNNDSGEKDDEDKESPRTTYYVYDNEDIIMEYNHKGKVTARYVHGAGIDEPLAIDRKGKTYYYHFDGLGSVTSLTDSKGKVAQRYEYDSFGKLKRHGNKVKQPYTYTAREYDRETGLYYYRARYYDATIGRFISFDPILHPTRGPPSCCGCGQVKNIHLPSFDSSKESPQKLNPYIYAENNSLNLTDPMGLQNRRCIVTCATVPAFLPASCYKIEMCGSEVIKRTWLGFFVIVDRGFGFFGAYSCDEFFLSISRGS